MYLLTAVINNEDLIGDLITGWLDIGITGATLIESTDSLEFISRHIPIFAGFRSISAGGILHNKTLFTVIKEQQILDKAVAFLETLCRDTEKPHQGIYFVTRLTDFGHLGRELDSEQRQRHLEKKLGKIEN
jgi:hypothetical protein